MKKSILVLALLLCLALTGCGNLLERSYEVSTPHVDRPATADDPSILRAENYRELVSAVFYFVSQGEESGVIQLYDYPGDVEADLTAACLEVATQDPLGAYFVDYIKHELVRVVSYDQATLSISYRRTPEQVASMVTVTGTSAIRAEVREALSSFNQEVVLRVAYLAEDEESLAQLVRQVYYAAPATALGMPQVEVNLYPDSGRERVVEILLTYPENAEELQRKREDLTARVDELTLPGPGFGPDRPADLQASAADGVVEGLEEVASYDPEGGATPYAAIVEGRANDEGMALAYALLCQKIALPCEIVEGTLDGEPWFWNKLTLSNGWVFYRDPTTGEDAFAFYTAQELFELGYRWPGGPVEEDEATLSLADTDDIGETESEAQP